MENIPSGEKGPDNKKTRVLEYLKQKLEKARKDFDSLNREVNYYKNLKPAGIPPKIPDEFESGGLDAKDWETEIGATREDEDLKSHFTSTEVLDELAHLEEFVSDLERDLREIESGNEQTIDHYWDELNKPQK